MDKHRMLFSLRRKGSSTLCFDKDEPESRQSDISWSQLNVSVFPEGLRDPGQPVGGVGDDDTLLSSHKSGHRCR